MAEGQKSASRAGFLIAARTSSLCLTVSVVVIPNREAGQDRIAPKRCQRRGDGTLVIIEGQRTLRVMGRRRFRGIARRGISGLRRRYYR